MARRSISMALSAAGRAWTLSSQSSSARSVGKFRTCADTGEHRAGGRWRAAPTGGPRTAAEPRVRRQRPVPGADHLRHHRRRGRDPPEEPGRGRPPLAPNDPHTIHLHGLDVDAANDGVPETSVGAVPANLCADGTTASDCSRMADPLPARATSSSTCSARRTPAPTCTTATRRPTSTCRWACTARWWSTTPTDPAAATGPGQGQGGTLYGLALRQGLYPAAQRDRRPRPPGRRGHLRAQHLGPQPLQLGAVQAPVLVRSTACPSPRPSTPPSRRATPSTDWIAAHPGYDPLITGSVSSPMPCWGTPGEKVLIRVINMGFETQPMHMHGYHGKIIGSDQRAWTWAITATYVQRRAGKEHPDHRLGRDLRLAGRLWPAVVPVDLSGRAPSPATIRPPTCQCRTPPRPSRPSRRPATPWASRTSAGRRSRAWSGRQARHPIPDQPVLPVPQPRRLQGHQQWRLPRRHVHHAGTDPVRGRSVWQHQIVRLPAARRRSPSTC